MVSVIIKPCWLAKVISCFLSLKGVDACPAGSYPFVDAAECNSVFTAMGEYNQFFVVCDNLLGIHVYITQGFGSITIVNLLMML